MAQDGVRGFEDQILELLVQADELDGAAKAVDAALSKERGDVTRSARPRADHQRHGGEIRIAGQAERRWSVR